MKQNKKSIEKINKTKRQAHKMFMKLINLQASYHRKNKKEDTNIRNERRNSPISPMYIEWIIMEYSYINIMEYNYNNSVPTNVITQMKWANSLKDTKYQNTQKERDDLNRAQPIKKLNQ